MGWNYSFKEELRYIGGGAWKTIWILMIIIGLMFFVEIVFNKDTYQPRNCEPPNCAERIFYPSSIY